MSGRSVVLWSAFRYARRIDFSPRTHIEALTVITNASLEISAPKRATVLQKSFSWLDGGCALLDDGHCVVEANDPILIWCSTTAGELRGRAFWPIVFNRYPHWKQQVTESLENRAP